MTLVIVMLGVLAVLVWAITFVPIPIQGSTEGAMLAKDVLDFRSGILTSIMTAFGAWIAAGAAYFFGTKNLQATTAAIQRAQETGQQRLSHLKVGDLQLQPIALKADLKSKIGDLRHALVNDPEQWWFAVLNDDGTLNTVLHEESLYRYVIDRLGMDGQTIDTVNQTTVAELIGKLEADRGLERVLWNISVNTTIDESLAALNARMGTQLHVAIVLDANGKPVYSLTGGTIKKALEES